MSLQTLEELITAERLARAQDSISEHYFRRLSYWKKNF